MRKLHLGSGKKYKFDYINIDINEKNKPDIVRDLERGLPFDDNSVDKILTEHCLEHIAPEHLHFVMYEIWRVLKVDGEVEIVVPIGNGWSNSPEHKAPFNENSWIFFTKWNDPNNTGYNFELKDKQIIRADVPDLENSDGYGDELHFILNPIK